MKALDNDELRRWRWLLMRCAFLLALAAALGGCENDSDGSGPEAAQVAGAADAGHDVGGTDGDETSGLVNDAAVGPAAPASARAFVSGQAQLQGRQENQHGGIRIEATGGDSVALTAADGRFELSVAPGVVNLEFRSADYGLVTLSVPDLAEGERRRLPDVIILPARPGRVSGSVALPPGFEVARLSTVSVMLWQNETADDTDLASPSHQTQLDPAGAFTLGDVLPGEYTLEVSAPGFASQERAVLVGPGERVALGLISLDRAINGESTVYLGRITLQGQTNHRGIRVESSGTAAATLTNDDGQFELAVIPGMHTLVGSFPGYGQFSVAVEPIAPGQRLDLGDVGVLAAQPGRLTGVVVLPEGFDGGPVLDAITVNLRLEDDGPAEPPRQTAGLDSEGRFTMDSVLPGSYVLTVMADGFEPYLQAFGIAPGEQKRLPVIAMSRADTPLDVATLIEGTVRRGGVFTPGRHGGIRVEALGTPFTTLTDADGNFVLAVSAGEHTVRASVFGYGGMSMAVGQVDAGARFQIADPLVLTPQPGGVRGRVNLPPGFGFHAYGQLSVSLMPINAGPGEEPVATTTVLADGRWSLDGVTANAYGLTVKGGSFMPAYRTVDLEPGVVTDLGGINLIPSLNDADNIIIRGRIKLGGLTPEAGSGGILVRALGTPYTTVSLGNGSFELMASPGSLMLELSYPGFQSLQLNMGSIAQGEIIELPETIVLEGRRGEVSGQVRLSLFETQARLRRVDAILVDRGGQQVASARAGGDGRFLIADVVPGQYTLQLRATGYEGVETVLQIGPGERADVGAVRLTHESALEEAVLMTVTVAFADGADPVGTVATISSLEDNLPVGDFVVDDDGTFTVATSRDEGYLIELSAPAYIVAQSYGPYRYDAGSGIFLDPNGFGPEIVLQPAVAGGADYDDDGVLNDRDNCPAVANETQSDLDGDGLGDVCDVDIDGDGLLNGFEQVLGTQIRIPDSDGDGLGDGVEFWGQTSPLISDTDADGLSDGEEVGNPLNPNDTDGDGYIDALESALADLDGDGAVDQVDGPGPDGDLDGDASRNGRRNAAGECIDLLGCDVCPLVYDPLQIDSDGDGVGDACSPAVGAALCALTRLPSGGLGVRCGDVSATALSLIDELENVGCFRCLPVDPFVAPCAGIIENRRGEDLCADLVHGAGQDPACRTPADCCGQIGREVEGGLCTRCIEGFSEPAASAVFGAAHCVPLDCNGAGRPGDAPASAIMVDADRQLANGCECELKGEETCDGDGVDEDCDGRVDEGSDCADVARCGNGITEEGEVCDDGNRIDEDACRNDCTPAFCGDGVTWLGVEECDDGNDSLGHRCSPGCLRVSSGGCAHDCDPVGTARSADDDGVLCYDATGLCVCSEGAAGVRCQERPACGDGFLQAAESCDDGGRESGDGCTANCEIELGHACDGESPSVCTRTCGNGEVDAGEECDDGNDIDGDGCSNDCRSTAFCSAPSACSEHGTTWALREGNPLAISPSGLVNDGHWPSPRIRDAIALTGQDLMVGLVSNDLNEGPTSAVVVYEKLPAGLFVESAVLRKPEGKGGTHFGYELAASNNGETDLMLVGAPFFTPDEALHFDDDDACSRAFHAVATCYRDLIVEGEGQEASAEISVSKCLAIDSGCPCLEENTQCLENCVDGVCESECNETVTQCIGFEADSKLRLVAAFAQPRAYLPGDQLSVVLEFSGPFVFVGGEAETPPHLVLSDGRTVPLEVHQLNGQLATSYQFSYEVEADQSSSQTLTIVGMNLAGWSLAPSREGNWFDSDVFDPSSVQLNFSGVRISAGSEAEAPAQSAVFAYRRASDGQGWIYDGALEPPGQGQYHGFGSEVALWGDMAVVMAYDSVIHDAGLYALVRDWSLHVYRRTGTRNWRHEYTTVGTLAGGDYGADNDGLFIQGTVDGIYIANSLSVADDRFAITEMALNNAAGDGNRITVFQRGDAHQWRTSILELDESSRLDPLFGSTTAWHGSTLYAGSKTGAFNWFLSQFSPDAQAALPPAAASASVSRFDVRDGVWMQSDALGIDDLGFTANTFGHVLAITDDTMVVDGFRDAVCVRLVFRALEDGTWQYQGVLETDKFVGAEAEGWVSASTALYGSSLVSMMNIIDASSSDGYGDSIALRSWELKQPLCSKMNGACLCADGFAGQRCDERARCGDGVVDYNESCDDRNLLAGDGCAPDCTVELGWDCSSEAGCLPRCGDGRLVLGEACDDGNQVDTDGCTKACEIGSPSFCEGQCDAWGTTLAVDGQPETQAARAHGDPPLFFGPVAMADEWVVRGSWAGNGVSGASFLHRDAQGQWSEAIPIPHPIDAPEDFGGEVEVVVRGDGAYALVSALGALPLNAADGNGLLQTPCSAIGACMQSCGPADPDCQMDCLAPFSQAQANAYLALGNCLSARGCLSDGATDLGCQNTQCAAETQSCTDLVEPTFDGVEGRRDGRVYIYRLSEKQAELVQTIEPPTGMSEGFGAQVKAFGEHVVFVSGLGYPDSFPIGEVIYDPIIQLGRWRSDGAGVEFLGHEGRWVAEAPSGQQAMLSVGSLQLNSGWLSVGIGRTLPGSGLPYGDGQGLVFNVNSLPLRPNRISPPPNLATHSSFARAMSLSDDRLIIASGITSRIKPYFHQDGGLPSVLWTAPDASDRVLSYVRDGAHWVYQSDIEHPVARQGNGDFGWSIAQGDGFLAITGRTGGRGDGAGEHEVYLFSRGAVNSWDFAGRFVMPGHHYFGRLDASGRNFVVSDAALIDPNEPGREGRFFGVYAPLKPVCDAFGLCHCADFASGAACQENAFCGDGIVQEHEGCDDGNANPFDGCNGRCEVEVGFRCTSNILPGLGSICEPQCGDGLVKGDEQCDHGGASGTDGCGVDCRISTLGECTTLCDSVGTARNANELLFLDEWTVRGEGFGMGIASDGQVLLVGERVVPQSDMSFCGDMQGCFASCGAGDANCAQACANQLSEESYSLLEARERCFVEECSAHLSNADGENDAENCIAEHCSAELLACEKDGVDYGEGSCSQIYDCYFECADDDAGCYRVCRSQGNEAANVLFDPFWVCGVTANCDAGDVACLQTTCQLELEACQAQVAQGGSDLEDLGGPDEIALTGQIHAYVRTANGSWDWQETLQAGADGSTLFGTDFAVAEGWVAVGHALDRGGLGRVYLYRQDQTGGFGVPRQVLAPCLGTVNPASGVCELPCRSGGEVCPAHDRAVNSFGVSLALENGRLVVGAHNLVFVYELQDGDQWVETARLAPAEPRTEDDHFGESVDLHGNQIAVGAVWADGQDNEPRQGAVFVFAHDGLTWVQSARLLDAQGEADDHFGSVLDLHGDTLMVARMPPVDGDRGQDVVFFERGDDGRWSAPLPVRAVDPQETPATVHSLALSATAAVVGVSQGSGEDAVFSVVGLERGPLGSWTRRLRPIVEQTGIEQPDAISLATVLDDFYIAQPTGLDTGRKVAHWMSDSRTCDATGQCLCKVGATGERCETFTCGNQERDVGEICDPLLDDGCSEDCSAQPGWRCVPGEGCFSVCGDGRIVGDEVCDDGNLSSYDECDNTCRNNGSREALQEAYENCRGDCVLVSTACLENLGVPIAELKLLVRQPDGQWLADGTPAERFPGGHWIWNKPPELPPNFDYQWAVTRADNGELLREEDGLRASITRDIAQSLVADELDGEDTYRACARFDLDTDAQGRPYRSFPDDPEDFDYNGRPSQTFGSCSACLPHGIGIFEILDQQQGGGSPAQGDANGQTGEGDGSGPQSNLIEVGCPRDGPDGFYIIGVPDGSVITTYPVVCGQQEGGGWMLAANLTNGSYVQPLDFNQTQNHRPEGGVTYSLNGIMPDGAPFVPNIDEGVSGQLPMRFYHDGLTEVLFECGTNDEPAQTIRTIVPARDLVDWHSDEFAFDGGVLRIRSGDDTLPTTFCGDDQGLARHHGVGLCVNGVARFLYQDPVDGNGARGEVLCNGQPADFLRIWLRHDPSQYSPVSFNPEEWGTSQCGNGVIDELEECDLGAGNGFLEGNPGSRSECSANCRNLRPYYCGDHGGTCNVDAVFKTAVDPAGTPITLPVTLSDVPGLDWGQHVASGPRIGCGGQEGESTDARQNWCNAIALSFQNEAEGAGGPGIVNLTRDGKSHEVKALDLEHPIVGMVSVGARTLVASVAHDGGPTNFHKVGVRGGWSSTDDLTEGLNIRDAGLNHRQNIVPAYGAFMAAHGPYMAILDPNGLNNLEVRLFAVEGTEFDDSYRSLNGSDSPLVLEETNQADAETPQPVHGMWFYAAPPMPSGLLAVHRGTSLFIYRVGLSQDVCDNGAAACVSIIDVKAADAAAFGFPFVLTSKPSTEFVDQQDVTVFEFSQVNGQLDQVGVVPRPEQAGASFGRTLAADHGGVVALIGAPDAQNGAGQVYQVGLTTNFSNARRFTDIQALLHDQFNFGRRIYLDREKAIVWARESSENDSPTVMSFYDVAAPQCQIVDPGQADGYVCECTQPNLTANCNPEGNGDGLWGLPEPVGNEGNGAGYFADPWPDAFCSLVEVPTISAGELALNTRELPEAPQIGCLGAPMGSTQMVNLQLLPDHLGLQPPHPDFYNVDIKTEAEWDTVLLVGETCDVDQSSLVECNDDAAGLANNNSRIQAAFAPGNYAIFVGGFNGAAGPVELAVTVTPCAGGIETCQFPPAGKSAEEPNVAADQVPVIILESADGHETTYARMTLPGAEFFLMTQEVTVGAYRRCVDAGQCTAPFARDLDPRLNWTPSPGDREGHPVNGVSWAQANAYATYENARLPTDVEWSFAARSQGQAATYPWSTTAGDQTPNCDLLIYDECDAPTTQPPCSHPWGNTAQGVCDMGGNVWEWVDGGTENNRIVRGGAWFNSLNYFTTSSRGVDGPIREANENHRYFAIGFRLAVELALGEPDQDQVILPIVQANHWRITQERRVGEVVDGNDHSLRFGQFEAYDVLGDLLAGSHSVSESARDHENYGHTDCSDTGKILDDGGTIQFTADGSPATLGSFRIFKTTTEAIQAAEWRVDYSFDGEFWQAYARVTTPAEAGPCAWISLDLSNAAEFITPATGCPDGFIALETPDGSASCIEVPSTEDLGCGVGFVEQEQADGSIRCVEADASSCPDECPNGLADCPAGRVGCEAIACGGTLCTCPQGFDLFFEDGESSCVERQSGLVELVVDDESDQNQGGAQAGDVEIAVNRDPPAVLIDNPLEAPAAALLELAAVPAHGSQLTLADHLGQEVTFIFDHNTDTIDGSEQAPSTEISVTGVPQPKQRFALFDHRGHRADFVFYHGPYNASVIGLELVNGITHRVIHFDGASSNAELAQRVAMVIGGTLGDENERLDQLDMTVTREEDVIRLVQNSTSLGGQTTLDLDAVDGLGGENFKGGVTIGIKTALPNLTAIAARIGGAIGNSPLDMQAIAAGAQVMMIQNGVGFAGNTPIDYTTMGLAVNLDSSTSFEGGQDGSYTVAPGWPLTLDFSRTEDPEGGNVTFSYAVDPALAKIDRSQGFDTGDNFGPNPEFTALVDGLREIPVTLTTCDDGNGGLGADPDAVLCNEQQVVVTVLNQPPQIRSVETEISVEGPILGATPDNAAQKIQSLGGGEYSLDLTATPGGSVVVTTSVFAHDPGGEALSIRVDIDGDGNFEHQQQGVDGRFSTRFETVDSGSLTTIAVEVSDDDDTVSRADSVYIPPTFDQAARTLTYSVDLDGDGIHELLGLENPVIPFSVEPGITTISLSGFVSDANGFEVPFSLVDIPLPGVNADLDGDGFSPAAGDCDDSRGFLYPYDSNGDGQTDRCGWRDFSVGHDFVCAIDSGRNIRCWGAGDGQGNEACLPASAPPNHCDQAVPPPGPHLEVAAGKTSSCALDMDGEIVCWGSDFQGVITQIPDGQYHNLQMMSDQTGCVLNDQNRLTCWGHNHLGQASNPEGPFTHYELGAWNGCALDAALTIECWGYTDPNINNPLPGAFSVLGVGNQVGCAIDGDQFIQCWGNPDDQKILADIPAGAFIDVDSSHLHACAVGASGQIQCWGVEALGAYNEHGIFYQIPSGNFTEIKVNYFNGCALKQSGNLACWGSNAMGQLNVP